MFRALSLAGAALLIALPLAAQDVAEAPPAEACTVPDSIAVRGNVRVPEASIRTQAGLRPGERITYRDVQRAIRDVFATGEFSEVAIVCDVDDVTETGTIVIAVAERPLVGAIDIRGDDVVSRRAIRDRITLLPGRALDPALLAQSLARIDSLYQSRGYYLAEIRPETTTVDNRVNVVFTIDEGRRLAVSGIRVQGNERVSDGAVVGAMKTRPEGFFWFRRGEFDDDAYAADLGERLPQYFAGRGYVDFQILRDTLVVDRERGKALIELEVEEGPQYRIGTFEVVGNRRFNTEMIRQFYPFGDFSPTLTERIRGLVRRGEPRDVFDNEAWEAATQRLRTAYNNEGYIYATIRPVIQRTAVDDVPTVNLRWEIEERTPAIINRVEIVGNEYTTEACIRSRLSVVPGDVFNQDRLIRSYQNISNLGFFESPLPPPDTRPANEEGDVDIIFRVRERRTGNVSFGASMGQGTGFGGFLGLDQPNLFGQCKRASLQWQFGRLVNDFTLSYTDPAIRGSRISGTTTAYHTRSRFIIEDLGRQQRTGGTVQIGLPFPRSLLSSLFLQYGLESVKYEGGIFETDPTVAQCRNCLRSSLGLTVTRDTRVDLPFPTAGTLQTLSAQFNGGPLGGTSNFQRYTTEVRAFAPLGQLGGGRPGTNPMRFVFGLTGRAGIVHGDVGPFFVSQQFSLGGVQFGEQLRGYEEFSITPQGVIAGSRTTARRDAFGSAFMTTTAELGLRLNPSVYVNAFYDAGNVWNRPREFDPTRLVRGAGIGVALVTPLGPLGLDWAYGFDRVDEFGRPAPRWQLHFKIGNIF